MKDERGSHQIKYSYREVGPYCEYRGSPGITYHDKLAGINGKTQHFPFSSYYVFLLHRSASAPLVVLPVIVVRVDVGPELRSRVWAFGGGGLVD